MPEQDAGAATAEEILVAGDTTILHTKGEQTTDDISTATVKHYMDKSIVALTTERRGCGARPFV